MLELSILNQFLFEKLGCLLISVRSAPFSGIFEETDETLATELDIADNQFRTFTFRQIWVRLKLEREVTEVLRQE